MGIFHRDEREIFQAFKRTHTGIKTLLDRLEPASLALDTAMDVADRLLEQRNRVQDMFRRRPETARRMCRRVVRQRRKLLALVHQAQGVGGGNEWEEVNIRLIVQRSRGKVYGSFLKMLWSSSRAGDALRRRLFGGTRGNEAAGSANDLR